MPVCIAGMHRSGTSMLARALNLSGLYLGPQEDIFAAAPDNPEGFWENIHFVRLNDKVLSKLGGTWDRPPALEPGWELGSELAEYRAAAEHLIEAFADHEPWGWKDPRNSLTIDFWQRLLPDQKVVICLRNPLEVAQSLTRRGYSSHLFGFNLWHQYCSHLFAAIPPERRVVTHFDAYFDRPRAELERVLDFVGISASEEQIAAALASIVLPLRHNHVSLLETIKDEPPFNVIDLYQDMCREAGPNYRAIARASGSGQRISKSGYEKILEARGKEELGTRIHGLTEQIAAMELGRAADALRNEKAIEALSAQVLHIEKVRAAQFAEKDTTIRAFMVQVEELSGQIAMLSGQVEMLSAQLQAVLTSRSWRLMMLVGQIRLRLMPPNSPHARLLRFLLGAVRSFVSFLTGMVEWTILGILRQKEKEGSLFQSLLDTFPEDIGKAPEPPFRFIDWTLAVNLAAQIALEKFMRRLDIPGDVKAVLAALKGSVKEDTYYLILKDLFLFEQFMVVSPDRAVYPLMQAAELPDTPDRSRKRNILFITSQFPSPYHGGGNRVLNFIKTMSEKDDIYLCTSFYPEEDDSVFEAVVPYCRSILKVPNLEFGSNRAEIQRWLDGTKMDIIHYEWPHSLENYDPDFGRFHVFTYMEAVSLRLLMDLPFLESLSTPWTKKFAELIHMLRLELADTAALDARIAVTTKDADFFRKLYPYQAYTVLNHGVTLHEFTLPDVEPEPNTLVFVGNYRHYPNVDAISYFFDEVWERIREEIPGVRIYLVGTNPPERILRLGDGERIVITGSVDDVRPYIQKASLCIAPLVTGAGMRGKVIEYAALHRTFVATSIATTDLVFEDGIDYMCADTPSEFAQKVVTLLKDPELAMRMAATAYETAQNYYDTPRLVEFLGRLYARLEKTGTP